jgi:O-antigen ligase
MHINKRILTGLVVLMPLIFWVLLREGYELPKWFLWRWGIFFIFLGEILFLARNDRKKNREEEIKVFFPPFVFPWVIFFFLSILSLDGAVNLQSGLLNIANLVLGFSLFLFISGRWEDFEIRALIPFLILPALPVAVYGIFQAVGCDFVHLAGPFRGAISAFGHRDFVAEYELMVLPLMMYEGFFYGTATRKEPRQEKNGSVKSRPYVYAVRILALTGLPIVYAHFIMTHTRGSYFALIVALAFMLGLTAALPRQNTRRWFAGTTALLLLLTGLFLARNFNLPGEKVLGGKNEIVQGNGGGETEIPSSLQSRMLIWKATLALFRSHPVLGVGAGNLNEVLPPYYPPELLKMFQGKLEAGTSHNEYLQVLAETGISGGFSFLVFLTLLLFFAERISWRAAKGKSEFLPFFLTASILGILTASLVSSPLQRPVTLFLFWLFIGFLTVFGKKESRSLVLNRKAQERILVGFVVVLGISAYNFGWRSIAADFYGQKSSAADDAGDRKQAVFYIEKALSFQPQNRNLLTVAGNTYLGAGRFEEAIRYYGRAAVYHPYWPQGYGNLGLALAQAGFFADAEKYLNYSLQLDAYQPLVHNTLGTVYFQQKRKQEAKEEFLKALAIEPDLILPKLNLRELEKNISPPGIDTAQGIGQN